MSADELRRVAQGPGPDEKPTGQLVTADVHCDGGAPAALARCREVMTVVLQHSDGEWVSDEQWRELLPAWFVEASAPDPTPEQLQELMARREAMAPEQRRAFDAERSQRWSIGAFVSNFDPEERTWYWWSAEVINDDRFQIQLVAEDWPAPVGALDWLLRAVGGREIDIDMAY